MKKLILSLFAISAMSFSFAAHAQFKDGEYTGEGQGKEGMVPVTVQIVEGKITDITVGENEETEAILMGAVDELIPAIVEAQGTEGIDVIAGATYSSQGIISAVNQALEKAK